MNTCKVVWSERLLREIATRGNVYHVNDLVEVTGGLRRDAELVGTRYDAATGTVELLYESRNVEDGEAIAVTFHTFQDGYRPSAWWHRLLLGIARFCTARIRYCGESG